MIRYYDGAVMVMECAYIIKEEHLKNLQNTTKGVGDKVFAYIRRALKGDWEISDSLED